MDEDDNASRRLEELDALRSFYADDLLCDETSDNTSSTNDDQTHHGPWRIRITEKIVLEINLPQTYPSSGRPIPFLRAPQWALDEGRRADIIAELNDMYVEEMEVAIMWAEHCRAELHVGNTTVCDNNVDDPCDDQEQADDGTVEHLKAGGTKQDYEKGPTKTFVPPTSKYGQPIRHFDAKVIMEDSNRRTIHRGNPFHPPKSGPSELMLAHAARVESMDHVNWVIAELLFSDKKVAKATHNMIAYRFYDKERECIVSDNDDDGEKGSGMKLAALLEISDSMNVIVVVSRWYGGIHLGPARFKHIASTARDVLVDAGFIIETSSSRNNSAEGDGRKRKSGVCRR